MGVFMIRVKFTDEMLKKIYTKAETEDRTVLGIIYSEYIGIHFPLGKILKPQNIYTTAKFISRLFELDKKLSGDEAKVIYIQYSSSIHSFKAVVVGESEMIATV